MYLLTIQQWFSKYQNVQQLIDMYLLKHSKNLSNENRTYNDDVTKVYDYNNDIAFV